MLWAVENNTAGNFLFRDLPNSRLYTMGPGAIPVPSFYNFPAIGYVLTRADTPHGTPEALDVVAGIQATTVVEQDVLAVAIVRGS